MMVLHMAEIPAFPYEQREKNVLYSDAGFKVRVVELPPGGEMPICEMTSHVIFYVVSGEATVTVDSESATIGEHQCLITGPAVLSMQSETGVKLLGVQIEPAG